MTPENVNILTKHLHHLLTLEKAGYMKGLNQHEINDLIQVARVEFFGAGYNPDVWCPPCLAEMIKNIYNQFTQYLKRETGDIAGYQYNVDAIEAMIKVYNNIKAN